MLPLGRPIHEEIVFFFLRKFHVIHVFIILIIKLMIELNCFETIEMLFCRFSYIEEQILNNLYSMSNFIIFNIYRYKQF